MGRVRKLGQHDPATGLCWHPGVKGLAGGLRSSKGNAATGPSRRDANPPPTPAMPPEPPASAALAKAGEATGSEARLWGQLSWPLIPVPLHTCSRSCEHFHLSAPSCPQHHMQCSPEGQDQGLSSPESTAQMGAISSCSQFPPSHASTPFRFTPRIRALSLLPWTTQQRPPRCLHLQVEFPVKLTRWCKSVS